MIGVKHFICFILTDGVLLYPLLLSYDLLKVAGVISVNVYVFIACA